VAILLLNVITLSLTGQSYCEKELGYKNNDYYISRVQLKEIDKSSLGSGYSDYTSEKAYLAVGHAYSVTITYYHQA